MMKWARGVDEVVQTALEFGPALFDTAEAYQSENGWKLARITTRPHTES